MSDNQKKQQAEQLEKQWVKFWFNTKAHYVVSIDPVFEHTVCHLACGATVQYTDKYTLTEQDKCSLCIESL